MENLSPQEIKRNITNLYKGQTSDLEKGGKGSGVYDRKHLATLVQARKKNPEHEGHHDALNAYVEKHAGEGSGRAFAESFDPTSHSAKDAHDMVQDMRNDRDNKWDDDNEDDDDPIAMRKDFEKRYGK